MPKKIKNCFYKNLTFEKLYEANLRARKHKVCKSEVVKFEINLENNLTNLLNKIRNHTYHLGKYYTFKVYEPKERTIKALPYVDRIVHQWYVEEFIKPNIVPKFISTTFACLKDRGTHKAALEVEKQIRICNQNNPNFWILKCDIKGFFYHIDPHILYSIMCKYIADVELLNFTKLLIFDGREEMGAIGIPIGNYTSQFFANIYLNELDQFVKRTLKIKHYVRYMDDFILLLNTKEECKLIKHTIETFLHQQLHLELNAKSKYYPNKMGVDFCGYRIFTTHKLLRLNSKKKIKKNVKKWNYLYKNNKLNVAQATESLNSWIGHASHCNSYTLQKKIINSCNFLLTDKAYSQMEQNIFDDFINNSNSNL